MDQPKAGSSGQVRHYYVAVGTPEAKLATLVDLLQALESEQKLGIAVCCGSRDVLDLVAAALLQVRSLGVWCLHADMGEAEVHALVTSLKLRVPGAASGGSGGGSGGGSAGAQLAGVGSPAAGASPRDAGGAAGAAAGAGAGAAAGVGGAGGAGAGAGSGEGAAGGEDGEEARQDPEPRTQVLVATDAALKAVAREDAPLCMPLLINYELAPRKDVLQKRQAVVLGGRGSGRRRLAVHFAVAGELGALAGVQGMVGGPIDEMPVQVSDIFG